MSDLAHRIERAREVVHPAWDDARAARVQATLPRRRRRRAAARAGVSVAAVALSLGLAWQARPTADRRDDVATRAPAALDPTVTPLDARSSTRWVARTPAREVVEVVAGRVRFDVPHRASRVFRVEAGDVAVQVLGTSFTVERTASGAVVSVTDGRVRVFWGNRYADLGAGESERFPRATPSPSQPAPAPTAEAPARPRRASAVSGDALVDEADDARRAGRPDVAAALLRRALAAPHPDASAAFTLGRVLRDDLHRPGEAADAFARAQQLRPDGPLADDALAHEVTCRDAAGQHGRAVALAEGYLRRHPAGPAADRVRSIVAR